MCETDPHCIEVTTPEGNEVVNKSFPSKKEHAEALLESVRNWIKHAQSKPSNVQTQLLNDAKGQVEAADYGSAIDNIIKALAESVPKE